MDRGQCLRAQVAEIGIQQVAPARGIGPAGAGTVGHYQVFGLQAVEEDINLVAVDPAGLGRLGFENGQLEGHRHTLVLGSFFFGIEDFLGAGHQACSQAKKQ